MVSGAQHTNAQTSNASNHQNNNRAAFEDSSSPFFLQNGDHPGLILVSHSLIGNNYNTWNRAMFMALTAKNKIGFVDGTFLQPPIDDLLYGVWTRCNSMVISWLLNSVTREIIDSLMYLATARDIWIDLRDRFHQSNAPRIFQIKKTLSVLQQGSMDVSAYYTRLRTLWDELKDFQPVSVCHCGSMKEWVTHQNQECVMQFLMGLNESYSQIRAQILMMDPFPTISKIFSLVVQEERQRFIHTDVPGSSLDQNLQVYPSANATMVEGPQAGKGGKNDKPTCSYCHYSGHTIDKCYQVNGYPPAHPKYKQKSGDGKVRVNQTTRTSSSSNIEAAGHMSVDKASGSMGDSLSPEQCKQLIAFLSSKLQFGYGTTSEMQQLEPSASCFSGPQQESDDWDG